MEAVIRCSLNNCFENLIATMKGFLLKSLKSLKNTREQVHFYQHCRPVNCVLTKLFSLYKHVLFGTLQTAASEPSRVATRRILCMKLTLLWHTF